MKCSFFYDDNSIGSLVKNALAIALSILLKLAHSAPVIQFVTTVII